MRWFVIAGAVVGCVWLAPAVGRACSPACAGAGIPATGSMLPRNAAVRFEEASTFSLDATLDGEAAVLVKIPELSGVAATRGLCEAPAVRVTPAPAIGQQLVIDPHTEDEEIVELTIGKADEAPPAGLTDVFVDVHDFPTHDGCNSCGHGRVWWFGRGRAGRRARAARVRVRRGGGAGGGLLLAAVVWSPRRRRARSRPA